MASRAQINVPDTGARRESFELAQRAMKRKARNTSNAFSLARRRKVPQSRVSVPSPAGQVGQSHFRHAEYQDGEIAQSVPLFYELSKTTPSPAETHGDQSSDPVFKKETVRMRKKGRSR